MTGLFHRIHQKTSVAEKFVKKFKKVLCGSNYQMKLNVEFVMRYVRKNVKYSDGGFTKPPSFCLYKNCPIPIDTLLTCNPSNNSSPGIQLT